jgi:hypothetical protein
LVEEDFLFEGSCVREEPFPIGIDGSVWLDEDCGVVDEPVNGAIFTRHAKDDVTVFVFRDFFEVLDGGSVEWFSEVSVFVFAAVSGEEVLAEDVDVCWCLLDVLFHGLDVFCLIGYGGSCGDKSKSHGFISGEDIGRDDLRVVDEREGFFGRIAKIQEKRENYIYLSI